MLNGSDGAKHQKDRNGRLGSGFPFYFPPKSAYKGLKLELVCVYGETPENTKVFFHHPKKQNPSKRYTGVCQWSESRSECGFFVGIDKRYKIPISFFSR